MLSSALDKKLKIGIWSETGWAFGRIARAVAKHAGPEFDIIIYDWAHPADNARLYDAQEWRGLDILLSNSWLLTYYEERCGTEIPQELRKKLFIIAHCPRFDLTQFSENLYYLPDVHYGGVSKETCRNLNTALQIANTRWCPFGADSEEFPLLVDLTLPIQHPIQRIGLIGAQSLPNSEYGFFKGQPLYLDICSRLGVQPIFITGHTEAKDLYGNLDLLICCSSLEGGPLGIFEAASCGIPVLTRRVGNVQEIAGIKMFDTAEQAVAQILEWNSDLVALTDYRNLITHEVRNNWSMKNLIQTHLVPWLKTAKLLHPTLELQPKVAVIVVIHTMPPFDRFYKTWRQYATWTEATFPNIRVYLALSCDAESSTTNLIAKQLSDSRIVYLNKHQPGNVYSKISENRTLALIEKTWNTMSFALDDFNPDLILRTNACATWHWPRYLEWLRESNITSESKRIYAGSNYNYPLRNCQFVSGSGITLSRDVAEHLLEQPIPQDSIEDDVYMALVLRDCSLSLRPTHSAKRLDIYPSCGDNYIWDPESSGVSLDPLTLDKFYHLRFRSDETRDRDICLHQWITTLWMENSSIEKPLSVAQINLAAKFKSVCSEPSDISEHCSVLAAYAMQCSHITEAGVRAGVASWALLQGLDLAQFKVNQKKTIIGIDLNPTPSFDQLNLLASRLGINYTFKLGNDLQVELEPTDLSFIDTWHVYGQLKRELARFAPITRKFIILHDTTVDAIRGESIRNGWNVEQQAQQNNWPVSDVSTGLWPAVEEFLQDNSTIWTLEMRLTNNNGLTVLRRIAIASEY